MVSRPTAAVTDLIVTPAVSVVDELLPIAIHRYDNVHILFCCVLTSHFFAYFLLIEYLLYDYL